jgi:hypothetical protein
MGRPPELRVAQVSIGVLLLVIIRSLREYFRLQYLHGDALVLGQVTPYVEVRCSLPSPLRGRLPPISPVSIEYRDCFGCRDRHFFVRL